MRVFYGLLIASLAVAAEIPSGESVLRLSVEKSGGAQAFSKVRNVTMTGTVDMAGHNITGPVSIYQQGDKSYTAIELPGIGKMEEGFNGETAWETNPLQGARIKDDAETTVMKRASRFNLLSSWREYYTAARTLGEADVDGKPAWKVELTPKEGKPETFFFDKDSALLVRMTQTIPSAMGEIPVEATMSDYRVVDGIRTPFSITQKAMSQVLVMHFDKVSYNTDIPESRFDLPAAIKELIANKTK